MRSRTEDVTEGPVADYGRLLYESAYLLATLAEAPPDARVDEFEVLLEIDAEGARRYFDLVQQLSSPGGASAARQDVQHVVSSVHALFGVFVRIGATLTASGAGEIPELLIENVRLIEGVSKSLAHALESQRDPAEIERCMWAVQLGVEAIERNLEALFPPIGGDTVIADQRTPRPVS